MKTLWVSLLFALAISSGLAHWDPNWYAFALVPWLVLLVREGVIESD
jgi:hypothetical protein